MTAIGRYRVPNNKVGIVRRRNGQSDPTFKGITPHDRFGIQARTLQPNRTYWLTPGKYTVEFVDAVHIPQDSIGVVRAKYGSNRPHGRTVGRHVECDNFQDGQKFLLSGGEQGLQIATLAGGQTYYINTELFEVKIEPRTYVPPRTIGMVTARVGRVRSPGARFGKYVECDNFQDGLAFLNGGGEQGRQLAILHGGAYYDINPVLFSVTTERNWVEHYEEQGLGADHLREIHVPIDKTGVVVTLDGGEPERDGGKKVGPLVAGHQNFRLPWVFLSNGGTRGVQAETIDGGSVFSLNPWFVRVIAIPTRELILEWSNKTPSEAINNYDAKLDRIVVTIQGYRLHVDVTQTLCIPESSAPRLVSEFGDNENSALGGLEDNPLPIQRFVKRVLGATVESYINQIAAESTIQEFIQRYSEISTDLNSQVRNALSEWGVKAGKTTLGAFEAEGPELNRILQEVATGQIRREVLEEELKNVEIKDKIKKVEILEKQRDVGLKLKAELNLLIEALGPNNTAVIHMIREAAKLQVPNYIGGDVRDLVQALPTTTLQTLLGQLHQLQPAARDENTPALAELEQESAPPTAPEVEPEDD